MTPKWTPFEKFEDFADGGEGFQNSRYVVIKRFQGDGGLGPMYHLSIHGVDREPIRDWRDLQRIKNELVGPEAEGLELFPAESRLVDTTNQFHLWVFTDFKFPFGYKDRLVTDAPIVADTRQRPFEDPPPDLASKESVEAKLEQSFGENVNGATTPQVKCPVRPTPWQPQKWPLRCQKCGKEDVFIEESADKINPDCQLLHPDDELRCGHCSNGCSGQDYCRDRLTML